MAHLLRCVITWNGNLSLFKNYKKINTKKRNHYYFKNNNLKINLRKLQLLREKA